MNPLCLEEGVGLMPWSPLAGGLLAGNREAGTKRARSGMNRDRYNRPADQAVVDTLKRVATARGETPAQVALAWLLSKPAVTAPIVGVTRPDQLDDALRAVGSTLSAEEIAALEAPYEPQGLIGSFTPAEMAIHQERMRGIA